MKLTGRLESISDLTSQQRADMLALMDRYYANITVMQFAHDLKEKQWVITLSDPQSGRLCGFSTQMVMHTECQGKPIHALFSGDTIIAPEYWGDVALSHVWGNLALALIDQYAGDGELYWFLISKGYKTYRFLPLFFHIFYPRYDVPTPVHIRDVIECLAKEKYAVAFRADQGIIVADDKKDCLRSGIAEITPERLHDPHVRYFLKRNPGYARGDELCCVAPLTRENFTPAAYRVIHAKQRHQETSC